MVDTIIVGRFLGIQSLAAVGATGSIFFLIIGFIVGLASGFSVIVSQKFGANGDEGVRNSVATSIILCFIITIIITTLSLLFSKSLLRLLNTPEDIINSANAYISVIYVGIGDRFIPMMAGVAKLLVRVIVAFTLPAIIVYTGICLASPIAWIAACIPLAIKYYKTIDKMSINDLNFLKTKSTELLG